MSSGFTCRKKCFDNIKHELNNFHEDYTRFPSSVSLVTGKDSFAEKNTVAWKVKKNQQTATKPLKLSIDGDTG